MRLLNCAGSRRAGGRRVWALLRNAGLAAALAAGAAAGCGLPTDEEAQAIDVSQLPESLRPGFIATTTTAGTAPLTVARTVYLLTQPPDTERPVVVTVERQVDRAATLGDVLATMFGESTSVEEHAAGYFNPLELYEIVQTTVSGDVATVDMVPLSPEDIPQADTLELVAAQLVFTASAWEGVDGVRILLNGLEVSIPTSDADAEPGSVLRTSAYEQFLPDFTPAFTTSTMLASDGA